MYYVYVIELDNTVGARENAKYPNAYVGQTYLQPDERFAQHKAGIKAAKAVKNHGKWLRRKLYEKYNPVDTRNQALAREAWLAAHLKDLGYTVYGGH
jgi:predicted GIY-YIG superfamily endonuclease